MRGTILGYNATTDEGVINDPGSERVRFTRTDWKGQGEPTPGRPVDYDLTDGRATDIFPVPGTGVLAGFEGQDPARQAMIFGIVSLSCAALTFVLGPLGIITAAIAVIFGIRGKNAGRDLPDKTGYYLSIAGLIIAAISLLFAVLALTALLGVLGVVGSLSRFH